jgi:hypothetical protein
MVDITIVNGVYKPIYNSRAPSCATFTIMFLSKLTKHWDENLLFLAKKNAKTWLTVPSFSVLSSSAVMARVIPDLSINKTPFIKCIIP